MVKLLLWILLVSFGISRPLLATAQETCPDLVLQAVETVGASCMNMGRNSVCYGNRSIDAVLTRPLSVEFFNEPSDQIQLVDVQSLHTAPLNLELSTWGIAVLNLQANLPQVLPGQAVTLLVLGDAELRNDAPISTTSVPLSTTTATSLVSQPDSNALVLAALEANAPISASGVSPDGAWLRVSSGDLFGWVARSAVSAVPDTAELPITEPDSPLPMQAFTFRAAVGGPRCAEAPPSILVMQGPQQVHVNLTVNGARMELGSTVALWQPDEHYMQLAVLDGEVALENGMTLPRGFTSVVSIDEDAQTQDDWIEPRELTPFEIAALLPLEDLPADLLTYPINVPEEGEPTETPVSTPTPTRQPTRPAPRVTFTPSPVPPTLTPVPQVSFTADSQIIEYGRCTTLRWASENIDSIYFEGQPTVGISSQEVCPPQTQTFVLLVVFRDGSRQTYSLTIQVNGPTSTPPAVCGNEICESGEDSGTCSADCVPVCGNAICEPGESSCSCNSDCPGSCIG